MFGLKIVFHLFDHLLCFLLRHCVQQRQFRNRIHRLLQDNGIDVLVLKDSG